MLWPAATRGITVNILVLSFVGPAMLRNATSHCGDQADNL
jgi:hypothetical protein